MAARVLLAQQQISLYANGEALVPYSGAWQWWAPDDIARITNTPRAAVESDWPIIYAALEAYGVADYDTVRVVLATIAIETAHTFKPVVEAFWLDDDWRYRNLRYAPYWGRGYVQLTWLENYQYYGYRIGHPEIVDFPDKALVPMVAAQLLAVYFQEKGINLAAQRHDWAECRRLVQGGDAGLRDFIDMIQALGVAARTAPMRLTEVLKRAYSRVGDPYVWDGEVPGAFDCSGFIRWAYNGAVDSYTDTIFLQTQDNLHPAPGDPVLYEYYDPGQPDTRFPHVGLWLDSTSVLDARYGYGVGVHPHLAGATQYLRRVPGILVDTLPKAPILRGIG